jgi:hypothetical protein
VAINGYGLSAVVHTVTRSGPVEHYPSLPVAVATIQSFATPALVFFGLIGCIVLLRHKDPLLFLIGLGLLLVARFLPFGVPKWILVAVPVLMVCALVGFSRLWVSVTNRSKRYALRIAMILLVLAPWLVGLQSSYGDSGYGPSFEVQPFDRPLLTKRTLRLSLGSGALVPTSEGPRPVGGHAGVLFGGGWRRNVRQGAEQFTGAIREGLAKNLPILLDEQQGFVVSTLLSMHFTTRDPWDHVVVPGFLVERAFTSQDGNCRVQMLELKNKQALLDPAGERRLQHFLGTDRLVLYGYTSTLRRCYRLAPESLQRVGAGTNTAVLNLEALHSLAGSAALSK